MKKRVLLVVVAVLMVITVFAGCSQQSSSAAATTPQASASQAAATSVAPASESASASATTSAAASGSNIVAGVDLSQYKDASGNPLFIDTVVPEIPERPSDPESLAETDSGHWFDYEYPYANIQKQDLPASPASDLKGKKVIVLLDGDHPYFTAYVNGAQQAADAFGLTIEFLSPNWDVNVQTQQVDQAINEQPDLIIYLPVDQQTSVQHLRKMFQAGLPVIGSNVMPSTEGFGYLEAFVGPADWGQSRALAEELAKAANYEGGYAILTHNAGTSAYYARLYGVETEMAKIAPNMKLLDVQTPGFEAEDVKSTVSSWITKFGDELKVIATSETTGQAIGAIEACEAANRTDIIIGGIDNSTTALDYVQGGQLKACTNQPPMQDGALAVLTAAKWLSGEEIAPVTFMAPGVITSENVENYMPGQW